MKKPEGLDKLKAALREIASVPKAEVDRLIAQERKEKQAKRAKAGSVENVG